MKKLIVFSLVLLGFIGTVQGQEGMVQSTKDAINFGTFIPSANRAAIYGIVGPGGSVVGDIYLDTAWHTSTVYFYSQIVQKYNPNALDSVSGYQARVDLFNNSVEFKVDGGVKAVDGTAIKRIILTDETPAEIIVNTTQYPRLPDVKGFFRLIAEGELTILQHVTVRTVNPTYNVALDVGTKDTRLYQKTEYYAYQARQLVKFKPTKKSLIRLMRQRKSVMEKFISDNDINFKNSEDLAKLVTHYNELSKK